MKKVVEKNNVIKDIIHSFKKIFTSLWIFSFIMNLLMLAPTFYMLQVYDRVIPSRNEMTLVMLSLVLVLLFLLNSGLDYVRSLIAIRLGNNFELELNQQVYTASFKANLNLRGVNAGQAITDLTGLRQFLTSAPLFALMDAPWFPINLVIIFLFNFKVGLFALVGTIILIGLAIWNERSSSSSLKQAGEKSIAANNLAANNLRNAEVIEALGMLAGLQGRWRKLQLEYLALQASASERVALVASITRFTRGVFQSLILGFGALLALTNEISPGMVIAASILMGRVMSPVESLIGTWRQIESAKNSYFRLVDLLSAFPAKSEKMPLPAPTGILSFDNVSAAPPGINIATLKNITFEMSPGDVVGVIGPSGAGKSTLARLMVGIWPAAIGKVRLDAADIFQWDKGQLGKHLGYLPQDVELFAGTISENICRFSELNSEKIIRASKLAGLHEFILHLPQGYDTPVSDGGKSLSGGQRQRIGLARAVYDDPTLVVLDEPNSNADEAGEMALVELIKSLKTNKTTVAIITHRMPIISQTNKILVLKDGAMQMYGPTEEVVKKLVEMRSATNPGGGGVVG